MFPCCAALLLFGASWKQRLVRQVLLVACLPLPTHTHSISFNDLLSAEFRIPESPAFEERPLVLLHLALALPA